MQERISLSNNFYLDEFLVSETAARKGLVNTIAIGSTEYFNLVVLAKRILQPLRNHLGVSVIITSGYRSRKVNKATGGSVNSDHCKGLAADIRASGLTPHELAQEIIRLRLPYKQLIHEFGSWVHVSLENGREKPRRQVLTAYKDKPNWLGKRKTKYVDGLFHVDLKTGDLLQEEPRWIGVA